MEMGNTVVFFTAYLCLLLPIFAVYWSTGGAPEILSLFFFSFSILFTSLQIMSFLALAIFNHHLDR